MITKTKTRGVASTGIVALLLMSLAGSTAHADRVRAGSLEIRTDNGELAGACPLEHTDVKAELSGFISRVTVTQLFSNPFSTPIEAIYVFPLSDRSAVDRMSMRIGDRTIKGSVREREEARRIYNNARNAGQRASLLDQERPNIFTQSVANIMPGENIEITLSYVEYLKYEDSEYEFSFPMVVGPRYIPSGNEGPSIPDAGRITPPLTPEGTRAGHDISLQVNIDAGMTVRKLASDLHEVDVTHDAKGLAHVALKNQKEIPNRDFVLRYTVAGDALQDAVLTHADARGGFFSLILQPPARVKKSEVMPKEMIFVIDRSGSMSGFPIEKAKTAMRASIEKMNANDTFNLVSFAGGTGFCFPQSVPNTRENRRHALNYLEGLRGGGGTEMMSAIRSVLGKNEDPDRLRVVCFMTDGFIGNDMAILDAVKKYAGTARVFAFGIGNSVNRFLIEGMAREGRGASEIITLASDGDAASKRFYERIHSPILTDISVDFGDLDIHEVLPSPAGIPDLFSAQPLILTGRYTKGGSGFFTVRGRTAQGTWEKRIQVDLPEKEESHDVLASLWARKKIDTLMAQDWLGAQHGSPVNDLRARITDLGVSYGLLTQYTSFVAVENMIVNEGGTTRRVEVPIEMADGVSYEGIVGSNAPAASPVALRKVLHRGAVPQSTTLGRAVAFDSIEQVGDSSRPLPSIDAAPLLFAPQQRSVVIVEEEADEDLRVIVEKKEILNRSKLHPNLHQLIGKAKANEQSHPTLKWVNGKLALFIILSDDSRAQIQLLKNAGAQVISHAHSAKTVLVHLRVQDLEAISKLNFVTHIRPATY